MAVTILRKTAKDSHKTTFVSLCSFVPLPLLLPLFSFPCLPSSLFLLFARHEETGVRRLHMARGLLHLSQL